MQICISLHVRAKRISKWWLVYTEMAISYSRWVNIRERRLSVENVFENRETKKCDFAITELLILYLIA